MFRSVIRPTNTVKWVTITPDWAALPSLRRLYWSVPASDGEPTPSEADMRHTIVGIYQNVIQQK